MLGSMREVTTIALPRAPKLTLATAPTQHPPPASTRAWSAAAGSSVAWPDATDVPLVLLVAPAGSGEIPMAAGSVRLDGR